MESEQVTALKQMLEERWIEEDDVVKIYAELED